MVQETPTPETSEEIVRRLLGELAEAVINKRDLDAVRMAYQARKILSIRVVA